MFFPSKYIAKIIAKGWLQMISNFEGLKKENGNNTYLRLVWQVAMWHINASYCLKPIKQRGE